MRSVIIGAIVLGFFWLGPITVAQDTQGKQESTAEGYVFAGFGAVNGDAHVLHFGGGAELNLYKGLGLGLEIGYLAPTQDLGYGVGVFSLDGQYTFHTNSAARLRPFLTGGYSLAFRNGTGNALNFGGGVHYWFKDRVGLRLELRDHVSPDIWNVHFWQARVGFDFR